MSDGLELAAAAPSLLKASLARSGKWATGVAFFGGVISDILNPLAPFAAYIALVAAVAAVIIGIAIVLRLLMVDKALPALVFASTAAAVAGGIFAVQKQSDAQDGIIAKLVPAITRLQELVGIVAARVEKIEQTVTETKQTVDEVKQTTRGRSPKARPSRAKTERLQATTEDVAKTDRRDQEDDGPGRRAEHRDCRNQASSSRPASSCRQDRRPVQADRNRRRQPGKAAGAGREAAGDDREDRRFRSRPSPPGFEKLAAQGGIIADPQRPDEFYHNARLHELSGDMLNARRAYLAFAAFDVDAVDPYLRFATLLRVQDGKAGAREVFGALAEKGKAPSLKLVHLLQFDDQQRLDKLNAFIAANPDYGPAYYLARAGVLGGSARRADACRQARRGDRARQVPDL